MRMRRSITRGAAVVVGGLLLAAVVAPTAQAQDTKQLYDKQCVACHGASGKGDGPAAKALKPPPVDFATALKGKSDADIAKTIKEGGKAVGKGASMPGFGAKLSDDQIKSVTEYTKGLSK